MTKALPLAAILLALAAAAPAATNPYSDALARLDPLRRAAVLRRAVLDSGSRCGRVDQIGRVPPYGNLVGWRMRCTPGGSFLGFIGPDGTVQVRTCADARKLNIPGCLPPGK